MLNKFLKNSIIYFSANAINKVITFGFWAYIARVMTIEEMGEWALLNVLLTLLTFFMTLEIQSGFNRYYLEMNTYNEKNIFEISIINLLIFTNIIFGFCIYLFKFLIDITFYPISNNLFLILLTIPFFSTISAIYLQKLRLVDKPLKVFYINIIQTIIYVISILLFINLYNFDKLFSIYLGMLLQYIFIFVNIVIELNYFKFLIDFKSINKSIKFSIILVPSVLGAYLSILSSKYIISKLIDNFNLGIFEVNNKILMIISLIMDSLYTATIPIIYQNYRNTNFKHEYIHLINSNLFVLLLINITSSIFNKEIILLMAGSKYISYSNYVFPFLLVSLFTFISRFLAVNIHLAQKSQFDLIPEISSGILNVFLNIVLITKYGLIGAVAASVLSYFVRYIIYCYLANYLFPELFVGRLYLIIYTSLTIVVISFHYLINQWNLFIKLNVFLCEIISFIYVFYIINKKVSTQKL